MRDDVALPVYPSQAFYYSPIFYTLPVPNSVDSNQQVVSTPPYPSVVTFSGISSSPGMFYPIVVPEQILPLPVSTPPNVQTITGIKTVSDVTGFHEEGIN